MEEEKDLIKRIQQGDKEAFGEVYNVYYDKIFRFAFRRTGNQEAAEDITSEVFVSAMKSIHRFKYKRSNSFNAWIYRIANNKICDYFRKNYRSPTIELEKAGQLEEKREQSPDAIFAVKSDREEIDKNIARLSEKNQQVVNLCFFEDMKAEEIAEIMECSVGAVYVRLHRALKKLRELMIIN